MATGCMFPDASDVSHVTDLRVASVVGSSPELMPGEMHSLSVLILGAEDEELEVLSWSCVLMGPGCLVEEGVGSVWGVELETYRGPEWSRTLLMPAELELGLSDDRPAFAIVHFVVACRVGACPLMEAWRQGEVTANDLATPVELSDWLPVEDAAVASRVQTLSMRSPNRRRINPYLRASVETLEVSSGEAVSVSVSGTPSMLIYGHVEEGSLVLPAQTHTPSLAVGTWVAPDVEKPTDVRLAVTLEDGGGGAAYWTEVVTVLP